MKHKKKCDCPVCTMYQMVALLLEPCVVEDILGARDYLEKDLGYNFKKEPKLNRAYTKVALSYIINNVLAPANRKEFIAMESMKADLDWYDITEEEENK